MIQEIKKFKLICDRCYRSMVVETDDYIVNEENNLQLNKDFVETLGWKQKEEIISRVYNYLEVTEYCPACKQNKNEDNT